MPSRRTNRPRPLNEIVHKAIKEAVNLGYDRGQVGVAMVGGAYNLVSTWADEDRSKVEVAMELRLAILPNGIDRDALRLLVSEREALKSRPLFTG